MKRYGWRVLWCNAFHRGWWGNDMVGFGDSIRCYRCGLTLQR